MSIGFFNTYADPSLYAMADGQTLVVIVLYVDDPLLTGKFQNTMAKIQADITGGYSVTVGSRQSKFFVMVIEDVECGMFVQNCSIVQHLPCHCTVNSYELCDTPLPSGFPSVLHTGPAYTDAKSQKRLIGFLMYLTNTTGPDIASATHYLGRCL